MFLRVFVQFSVECKSNENLCHTRHTPQAARHVRALDAQMLKKKAALCTYVLVSACFTATAAHARQTSPSRGDLVIVLPRVQAWAQARLVEALAALCAENEV